jgi:hypothetical protein
MSKFSRKALFRGAFAGLAGLLYPGIGPALASARSAPARPIPVVPVDARLMDGADPSFWGGEVVARSGDKLLLRSAAGERTAQIPATNVVWKEFYVSPSVIEIGDWVDVKGVPQPDGALLADDRRVWVNIGRRDGVVEAVTGTGLLVRHRKGRETFELSSTLEVISATTGQPLPAGLATITPGTTIGTVGLRLRGGGYRITRLWALPDGGGQ